MNLSSRTNIIFMLLGLVLLAALAYFVFFRGNNEEVVTASGAPGSDSEMAFVNLAEVAGAVSFDAKILADPRFAALVDIRTLVVPEAAGRKDPFGPLGGTK